MEAADVTFRFSVSVCHPASAYRCDSLFYICIIGHWCMFLFANTQVINIDISIYILMKFDADVVNRNNYELFNC